MDSRTAVFEGKHGKTLKYGMLVKHIVVFVFDVIVTIIIVNLFEIQSEWGWVIVYLAVVLIGYIKSSFQFIATRVAYRLALKPLLVDEIKENLGKYHNFIDYDQHHISNYDDFLQAAASSERLQVVERIRAGVTLGMLKQNMILDRGYENRVWSIFYPLHQELLFPDE